MLTSIVIIFTLTLISKYPINFGNGDCIIIVVIYYDSIIDNNSNIAFGTINVPGGPPYSEFEFVMYPYMPVLTLLILYSKS